MTLMTARGVEGRAQGEGHGRRSRSPLLRRLSSTMAMSWLVVVVVMAFASLPVAKGRGRIVGGDEVTEIKYPWLASLMKGNSANCAGALIAPRWVLTAAHCIGRKSPNRLSLSFLDKRLNLPGIRKNRKVARRIKHPQFNGLTFRNDIALLKLNKPINDIEPIELHRVHDLSPADLLGIAGWGDTRFGLNKGTKVLREATVRFVSDANCSEGSDFFDPGYDPKEIFPGMMCAAKDGVDTCQGDSGGPMFFREGGDRQLEKPMVAGIVSWGEGCAKPGFPGVYTQVSEYIGWIESVAGKVGQNAKTARDAANELCKALEPDNQACKADNACKLVDAGDGKICRTKIPK